MRVLGSARESALSQVGGVRCEAVPGLPPWGCQLRLGKSHLDLVAQLDIGQTHDRRVQSDVGPPSGRPIHGLEVQKRQLAGLLGHDTSYELQLVLNDRRGGVFGQLLDEVTEEQVLVRPPAPRLGIDDGS